MSFNELIKTLRKHGYRLDREKGAVRFYRRPTDGREVRVDYHGAKEVANGTARAILKQAGIDPRNP